MGRYWKKDKVSEVELINGMWMSIRISEETDFGSGKLKWSMVCKFPFHGFKMVWQCKEKEEQEEEERKKDDDKVVFTQ